VAERDCVGFRNANELAAILKHFNKRTSKAEKEEQKKLVQRWESSYRDSVQASKDLVEAAKERV
jgi:uncharacterized protein YnzC (UPF0291/DUF896 family)